MDRLGMSRSSPHNERPEIRIIRLLLGDDVDMLHVKIEKIINEYSGVLLYKRYRFKKTRGV